jgi:hypothetical protein
MSEKILNARELAQVKRIAQNVDADYQKVCKLNEKIAELTKERDSLQQGIDEQEAPVIRKTGFKSTDIYTKVIVPQMNEDGTAKVDKNGRPIKVTKYTLRFPDTIIPVAGNTATPAPEAPAAGSDFDKDAEQLNTPTL